MKEAFVKLLGSVSICTLLFLLSCTPESDTYRFVELSGDEPFAIASFFSLSDTTISSNGENQCAAYLSDMEILAAAPAESDDIFHPFIYRKTDGEKLNLKFSGNGLYINGQLRSIHVGEEERSQQFEEWFQTVDADELSTVRIISGDEDELKRHAEKIRAIQRVSKTVSIWPDAEPEVEMLLGSSPEILNIEDDFTPAKIAALDMSKTAILFIEWAPDDIRTLKALNQKAMPSLRFILADSDVLAEIPDLLMSVEKLAIADMEPAVLRLLPNLKVIYSGLLVEGELADISQLIHPGNLECLSLIEGETFLATVSDGRKFEGLKGLSLAGIGSESDLSKIVQTFPNLEYLDLSNREVETFAPLVLSKKLKGITLDELKEGINFSDLAKIPKLKYLCLSEDLMDKPGLIEKISAACPRAMIYKHEPFCLGTGWLLLFLPVISGLLFFKWRSEKSR